MPLQGFVTNQTAQQNNLLQGHAVLASHGSNIVHTQNALIQNPNVVNVNVAHVLPNQLNLQVTEENVFGWEVGEEGTNITC